MKTRKINLISAILVFIFMPSIIFAQSLTGQEIIEKVYSRPAGETMQAELTMTLTNSRGDQRIRKIRQYKKDSSEVEKKIMFFVAPADVYNTSFMNWSYSSSKDDDQWIYLPALKKVKRISSSSKGDYFMGSDFTYDDLGERHPEADKHRLLREEEVEGQACYVVESIPLDNNYMYSRTVTWIAKDKWIGLKKEFFDEDGVLLKTLKVNGHKKIDGYWYVVNTEMHNVQRDHKTIMLLENIRLDEPVQDSLFSERMMRRGL